MGKFNFGSAGTKSNFGEFIPYEFGATGRRGAAKSSRPLFTMTKTSASRFNSVFGETIMEEGYQYVECAISKGLLGFRFMKNKTENSLKLGLSKQDTGVSVSMRTIIAYLENETDLINTNVYRYTFKVEWDYENIYYIDLANPIEKVKLKSKK